MSAEGFKVLQEDNQTYRCKICDLLETLDASVLIKHIKTVHPNNPVYRCWEYFSHPEHKNHIFKCTSRYAAFEELKLHIREDHGYHLPSSNNHTVYNFQRLIKVLAPSLWPLGFKLDDWPHMEKKVYEDNLPIIEEAMKQCYKSYIGSDEELAQWLKSTTNSWHSENFPVLESTLLLHANWPQSMVLENEDWKYPECYKQAVEALEKLSSQIRRS